MPRNSVGVLAAIFSLVVWADPAAAMPAGIVLAVNGSCTNDGSVLNHGDAVQIGHTLIVPTGGNLKLRMADGSEISVAPSSSVSVAGYDNAGSGGVAKLLLTQGLLRVKSVTRPFEVSTVVGTASVSSGTADWFVESKTSSARVAVLAGIVDLRSNLTGESVSIPAHWGAHLEAGRVPVPPRVWNQAEFNAFFRLTQ
jgi:hypothetical protein